MDMDWLQTVMAAIAQHGPWAILAFWLAYMHIKRGEEQTKALVQTAEAITALRVHVEALLHMKDMKEPPHDSH